MTIIMSCNSNGQKSEILDKNNCFDVKLEALKSQKIYKEVMSQFIDTFRVWRDSGSMFGRPNVVSNKIDESVFFNSKKEECLLIVLQRFTTSVSFGQVRVVRGRFIKGRWIFKPSMVFEFGGDYFKGYKENNFETISKLGRYSVLTEGETLKDGCEIDEDYWFKLMPTD